MRSRSVLRVIDPFRRRGVLRAKANLVLLAVAVLLSPGGLATLPAAAASTDTATIQADLTLTRPGFSVTPGVGRIGGASRYETAAQVSASQFAPGVPVAYLTVGDNFPDALAAGPVAALQGGPVLLTAREELPAETAAELARLKPAKIVILGATISSSIQTSLSTYTSGPIIRLAGSSRYETAAQVSASQFAPGVPVAYLTVGDNFPDALAAGPVAGAQGGPVLLTSNAELPPETAVELSRLRPAKIVILGATISSSIQASLGTYTSGPITRLAGPNRYATAAKVSASQFAPGVPVAYLTVGDNFPDALAAGPVAALQGGPVLLTPIADLPAETAAELARLKPAKIVILGRTVAPKIEAALGRFTSGAPRSVLLPLPNGGTRVGRVAMDCPTVGGCIIVGSYRDATGQARLFAAAQEGNSWSVSEPPLPADASASWSTWQLGLARLSCTAPGTCVAVGGYPSQSESTPSRSFAATLSAGVWTAEALPVVNGGTASLPGGPLDLSCAGDTCVAVDQDRFVDSPTYGTLLTRTQGQWSAQWAPDGATLVTVECAASGACSAFGMARTASGGGPVGARWSGPSWSQQQLALPSPGQASTSIQRMSCGSVDSCVGVGDTYRPEGTYGQIAMPQGSSWNVQYAPLPGDALAAQGNEGSRLTDISCTSASSCVAVGTYRNSASGQALVNTLQGETWTPSSVTMPGAEESGIGQGLVRVDCAASGCAALGINFSTAYVALRRGAWWQYYPLGSLAYPRDLACSPQDVCVGLGVGAQGLTLFY